MTWGLLTQLTHRLAEYTVAPGPTDFGVRSSDCPPVHDVGRYGSPRWRLVPALAPDDNYVGASAVHGALFFDCLDRVDSAGAMSAPAGWRMP